MAGHNDERPVEGYVKFLATVHDNRLAAFPSYAERLDRLNLTRTRLHDLNLIGMNADGIGFGNVSIRIDRSEIPGSEHSFVVSGTATGGKRVLDREEYCEILSFNLSRNSVTYNGRIPPSAETMSHGAVYRALPEVNCVIHIHNLPMFEFMLANGYPGTPADTAYGTPRMAEDIFRCAVEIGETEGILVMAGHREGVLAYGIDPERTERLIMDVFG